MKKRLFVLFMCAFGFMGCKDTTIIGGADEPTEIVVTDKESIKMMVKVKEALYINTGEVHMTRETILVDGSIESEVDEDQIPTDNNQSNFGVGYNYHIQDEQTLLVEIDSAWFIFTIEHS